MAVLGQNWKENNCLRHQNSFAPLDGMYGSKADMPFGHRRVEVGIMLRIAMFVNGVLCNSKAWYAISKKHIEEFEVMDKSLLRYITGAHAKTQNEFLYLETGVLNIEKIISNRRMMYFQTIVKRDES